MEGTDQLQFLVEAVMNMMLEGDSPELALLRRQYAAAEVRRTELTGVGLYVYFNVPEGVGALETDTLTRGSVQADIQGLKHGAGFELFVHRGYLDFLEGFTYDEPWPESIGTFTVRKGPGLEP